VTMTVQIAAESYGLAAERGLTASCESGAHERCRGFYLRTPTYPPLVVCSCLCGHQRAASEGGGRVR
jgi:hypothetical protein